MRKTGKARRILLCVGLLSVFCFLFAGCLPTSKYQKKTTPTKTTKTTQKFKKPQKKPTPLYYDFGDVLIPSELKINRKASFVYETSGFSAGVLVLSGRVELNSLIAFFTNNMTKDNWKMVSSIKSARTLMLFKKESRWCVVTVLEKDLFNTEIEIWVAPTMSEGESGLFK